MNTKIYKKSRSFSTLLERKLEKFMSILFQKIKYITKFNLKPNIKLYGCNYETSR